MVMYMVIIRVDMIYMIDIWIDLIYKIIIPHRKKWFKRMDKFAISTSIFTLNSNHHTLLEHDRRKHRKYEERSKKYEEGNKESYEWLRTNKLYKKKLSQIKK